MVNRQKLTLAISVFLLVVFASTNKSWNSLFLLGDHFTAARFDYAEQQYLLSAGKTKAIVLEELRATCMASFKNCVDAAVDRCESKKSQNLSMVYSCKAQAKAVCDCYFEPLIAMPRNTFASYWAGVSRSAASVFPLFRDLVAAIVFGWFIVFVLPWLAKRFALWIRT